MPTAGSARSRSRTDARGLGVVRGDEAARALAPWAGDFVRRAAEVRDPLAGAAAGVASAGVVGGGGFGRRHEPLTVARVTLRRSRAGPRRWPPARHPSRARNAGSAGR